MSRLLKIPLGIPSNVEVTINKTRVSVKGPKGELTQTFHDSVIIKNQENSIIFSGNKKYDDCGAQAGTARAIVNNFITGVTEGFEKKLQLVGVGYRAQMKGKVLDLTLGYSHPINFSIPEGIEISTPSQTEIVVKGTDKALVGQVAAQIREYRKSEPYKGKGIKYEDEVIIRKEAKKK